MLNAQVKNQKMHFRNKGTKKKHGYAMKILNLMVSTHSKE